MSFRHHYRRGAYPLARESGVPRWIKSGVALLVLLTVVWWIGSRILGFFGVGNPLERASAILLSEDKGLISVSLQGEDLQPAQNGMLVFPGDMLDTGPNAHASLKFFDGSWTRNDGSTQVEVEESARGRKESRLSLDLKAGTVWISVPDKESFTGAIVRRVTTPTLRYALPPGTEALLSAKSLSVFSADGAGVIVSTKGQSDFTIGEGQQWTMPPDDAIGEDPYAFRTPLPPAAATKFVLDSRAIARLPGSAGSGSNLSSGTESMITLTAPAAGFILKDPTFTVRGSVGPSVASVTVNGRPALFDADTRQFSQEVNPPTGEGDVELSVEALDANDSVLQEIRRTIRRETAAAPLSLPAPIITDPVAAGGTYKTDAKELLFKGTASKDAQGIMVNDYKLQLFTPGKGTWSYLGSIALGNMKNGTNTYDVVALDAAGNKSPAARITIVIGEGEGGVTQPSSAAATSAAATSSVNPATLPKNDPITPGILSVAAPTAGTQHTETGTGFLLEGHTSAGTDSMWINDYQLKLYKPGKTFWNYIAVPEYGNLKRGTNLYVIIARNAKGEILDRLDYTVTYEPVRR